MSGKKHSLQAKAIVLVSLFMLITYLLFGVVLTRQARGFTKTLINEHMLDVVKTAAGMLDGDALGKLTPGDADTPEYQAVVDTLTVIYGKRRSGIHLLRPDHGRQDLCLRH